MLELPRPGPNSRVPRFISFVIAFSFLIDIQALHCSRHKGEGFLQTMLQEGAPSGNPFGAKYHGAWPKKGYDPAPPLSKVGKRSWRRAQNRAFRFGHTWYNGRMIYPSGPAQTPKPAPPTTSSRPSARPSRKSQRWTHFSWNSGGLALHKWDALQLWLQHHNMDIIYLQETHWSHASDWCTNNYFCIHSGTASKRGAGVMTMVSRRICGPTDLAWQTLCDGRLLHVQVCLHGTTHHLINCYQHVLHGSDDTERAKFWDHLTSLLDGIPNKHYIYIAGDLNTSLPTQSTSVGWPTFRTGSRRITGKQHQDWKRLHSILTTYDLTALNSWAPHLGPTYNFENHEARIDYIFIRRVHADSTARDVKYLHHHPLVPLSGAKHFPLLTSISTSWYPHRERTQSSTWNYHHRQQAYYRWHAQDQLFQQARQHVTANMENLPPQCSCRTLINSTRSSSRPPPTFDDPHNRRHPRCHPPLFACSNKFLFTRNRFEDSYPLHFPTFSQLGITLAAVPISVD